MPRHAGGDPADPLLRKAYRGGRRHYRRVPKWRPCPAYSRSSAQRIRLRSRQFFDHLLLGPNGAARPRFEIFRHPQPPPLERVRGQGKLEACAACLVAHRSRCLNRWFFRHDRSTTCMRPLPEEDDFSRYRTLFTRFPMLRACRTPPHSLGGEQRCCPLARALMIREAPDGEPSLCLAPLLFEEIFRSSPICTAMASTFSGRAELRHGAAVRQALLPPGTGQVTSRGTLALLPRLVIRRPTSPLSSYVLAISSQNSLDGLAPALPIADRGPSRSLGVPAAQPAYARRSCWACFRPGCP